MALVYEVSALATHRPHPVAISKIGFSAFVFVGVCCWIFAQLATFAPSGHQHPIWQMAREALGRDVAGSITVNRDATSLALLRFLTYGAAFWLALQFCRSAPRAQRLLRALALIGGAYAAYGIVTLLFFPRSILWFEKTAYFEFVTSTFINRNSYATYAGLGLTANLAVISSLFLDHGPSRKAGVVSKLAYFSALAVGEGGLWIFSAAFLGAALVLTGSRGGVIASLGGFLIFLLLAGMRGRKNALVAGLALTAVCLTVGVAVLNFGGFLADRLSLQGLASDSRLAVYSLTWQSINDAQLFGSGDGTFQHIFPMYRDRSIGPVGFWDKAHNTYLEALQGLGIPMASLLFAAVGVFAARCAVASLTRRRSSAAPLAATVATAIVMLHSFVDFSLQMQAVALTYAAMLGAGVAQSWSSLVKTFK